MTIYCSVTSVDFQWAIQRYIQEIELSITTSLRISNPTNVTRLKKDTGNSLVLLAGECSSLARQSYCWCKDVTYFHKTSTGFVSDNKAEPTILKLYFLDENFCCRRMWCGTAKEESIPAQHQDQYASLLRISSEWKEMLWEREPRQFGVYLFTKNCTWTRYYR
jgi:hypothetical protein